MENKTYGSITTQTEDMVGFCRQAVQEKRCKRNLVARVLPVVASALLRPSCDGPADWRKSAD
jgi:hypothetical protein